MNESIQTKIAAFHDRGCAFSGLPLDDANQGSALCSCDPDGSRTQALRDWVQRQRRLTVLSQDEVWFNKEDEEIRLEDMSLRYLKNVLNFIEQRAGRFKMNAEWQLMSWAGQPHGDAAQDSLDMLLDEMLETTAMTWLYQQPLVRRIDYLIKIEHDGPID